MRSKLQWVLRVHLFFSTLRGLLLISLITLITITVRGEDIAALTGQLNLGNHCTSATVSVDAVYLTCDSPGSYYYASSSYRESSRCKYEDKANLYILFTIDESFAADTYGIDLIIDSGVVASFTNVLSQTNLCYPPTGSVSYLGDEDGIVCPYPGSYKLYTYFYIPAASNDAQLQYTPDIRIQFNRHETTQSLGCATTGTSATIFHASTKAEQGNLILGIALTVFTIFFGACLCLSYRRKKQQEEILEERKKKQTAIDHTTPNTNTSRYFLHPSPTPPHQVHMTGEQTIQHHHHESIRRHRSSLQQYDEQQQQYDEQQQQYDEQRYDDDDEYYYEEEYQEQQHPQYYHHRNHHNHNRYHEQDDSNSEPSLGNPVWR